MNFQEAKRTVFETLNIGDTPIIMGEAGIGKTALAKEIADDNDMLFFNIDCNLLKDGEVGGKKGLPVSKRNL